MAGIETSIKLHDGVSPVLQKISRTLDAVTNRFTKLQGSLSKGLKLNAGASSAEYAKVNQELVKINSRLTTISRTSDRINGSIRKNTSTLNGTLTTINKGIVNQTRLLSKTRQIKPAIDQNGRAQLRFNEYVRGGVHESSRFLSNIRNALGVYLGFQSVKGILNTADTLTTTKARLDLVNDGFQTTKELQQKIYESAMNSRAGYAETADVVAKLATRAGKVFSNNDETIAFANTLQKMFHIAGASTQEMNSASLQLVQALGSGVLRGEELNAVFEAAPNVIQAIADYMDKPIGQIREMAKKGEITAGIVKNAMFAAADDVNKKFASMPITWAQAWVIFKNFALKVFEPLMERISAITASDRFKGFADGIARALSKVAAIITEIFDKVSQIAAWIYDNWNKLTPIIQAVTAALITFRVALFTTKVVLAAYNLWLGIMRARQLLAAKATFLQTSQQVGLNMALMACPWVWVVGGILAMIAVIGTIIAYTYDWEKSNIDFKQTMFNVMTAIKNIMVKTANFLKSAWLNVWDKIKQLALEVWDVFKAIGRFFVDNWSLIAPIVWGIVGAFAAYKLALFAIATWHGICAAAVAIWTGIVAVAKFVMSLFSIATWKQVAANIAMTVSGWAATSPLLFWIIVIVAIIALFYIAIAAINKWCGTSISATGLIAGYFTLLYAHIWNIFAYLWNYIASWVEFFANVFTNPIYSVKKLFVNLATNVIDCLIAMTKGCDKFATAFVNAILWAVNKAIEGWNAFVDILPDSIASKLGLGKGNLIEARTSFTSDLESAKASLNGLLGDKPADYWEAPKMEFKNLGEYAMKGYNWGANLGDKLGSGVSDLWSKGKDKLSGLLEGASGFDPSKLIATKDPSKTGNATDDLAGDLGKALGGGFDNPALDKIAGDTGKIANNTGETADNTSGLAVSEEHLGYMRNLAEREAINRFTSSNTKVEMTNNNKIDSKLDMDEFVNYIIGVISNPRAAKTHS